MRARRLRLVAGPVDDEAFAAACALAQRELLRLRSVRAEMPTPAGQLAAQAGNDNATAEVRRLERGQR